MLKSAPHKICLAKLLFIREYAAFLAEFIPVPIDQVVA
jgi:hypothetical protein